MNTLMTVASMIGYMTVAGCADQPDTVPFLDETFGASCAVDSTYDATLCESTDSLYGWCYEGACRRTCFSYDQTDDACQAGYSAVLFPAENVPPTQTAWTQIPCACVPTQP